MKKLYFGFLFLLVTVMSFAQNAGDYQTAASGDWTNLNSWSEYDGSTWVTPAISYPGQINGSYEVSVSAAHTIDFRTTLTILHTGILNIAGTLNLDVAGNGNPDTINLNTTAINVNGGNLNFVGNKVRLNLPASAVITITSGGTITASSCNANNQIYIGANKYASCVGGGGGTYTFGEVVAAGGTVNAAILTPTSGLNSEACSAINIEGGYTGPDTNVTFNWILTDSNGNISNIGSGTLADNTQTDIDSFTPTTADEYLLSFEVTSGTFVNVETIVITVTADVTGPSLTIPTNTTPECSDDLTPTAQGTATATDLCDSNPVITFSDSTTSGNCSDAYTIIRTWTATDADNNTTSLSQTINVQDTTNPVLTVPADVTVECDSIPGVGTPTATDNCDAAVSINYDGEVRTNGACTDTYTLTRTWTATDNCNNTHTLSQTINVQDTTNPVLTVPADVTVECDSIPGVGTPTATDNCDAAVSINYDGEVRTNGACTDTYTLTRTWTATDNCNNTHTLSQTINVQDTTNPVLTVPADVTVECDSIPGVGTPTATDNCDAAVSINYDGEVRTNGACTDTYTLTRTWTATDNCNNTHTLSQTINVQDTTNPVLTVPADVTVECDSIPGVGTPTATDNCDAAVSINYDGEVRTNGACTDTYTLTRTWTATDNCNNTHTLSQTINVQDTTNPVLTVPADVTVECDSIPGVGTPTATDNCDAAVSINYDGEVRTNGACTDTYTLTRTWTATDNCNNTHTLSQTINVQDTTNPVLTVPADVTVECDSIPGVGTPTATDNCDAAVSINYDGEVRTNGACTDTYTLTRTWTATDNCNNTHTLSQTINVQDTTNPVLTVPADVTVECDSIPGVGTPTATDNCDAAVSINYDGEVRTNGACTDTYTLTRTWTATDNCNNTHTLSQTINVQDTTNPVLTVPADVTVECDSIPGVGTPTATDNCDAAVSINYDGEVRTNGACTDTYTLTRTWTATDNCNNTHTLSQTINVQDTTNPVLTVPADVTVECDSIPGVGTPTATDNCDAAVSINYDGEVRTNGACTDTYTLTRTWTATDNCNNTHTLSQTINVQDTTNPVLTVPADVTVECDSIPGVGTPTATDNCDAAVSINYDGEVRTNGACTDTYTLTRTWTATDNCNNTHTLSQTINVQDTTNPVLTVPADVTVECDSIPGVGTPTATDNCDAAVSINYDGEVRTNGACTDTYTLTRTWTATDNCNNTHTLSQTINVQDTTNPVLTVPADVTVECDSIPGVGTPTATDNCDAAVSINYDGEVRTNGACTDTYTLTRTWTATDNCNNTHTLSQTINVQDTTNPVLTVPADVTVECDSIPGVGTPTATDNCDAAVSINYDGEVRTNGACTDTYTLTRTWTATDNCNNTHTLSQTINVQDTTNPVLTVPADVTVECDSIPGVGTPTATDNCDAAVSINYDGEVRTNGACTDTYTLTRTWTATDNCNNTHTLSQTINVQDTTNPVLTVPADVTVECDSIPGVGTPTATDNCDANVAITFTETTTAGACPDAYTITRTWTATDNCGNTDIESQVITVVDTTDPVITTCLGDQNVSFDNNCEYTLLDYTSSIVATDNCGSVTITQSPTAGTTITATTQITITATDDCGNTSTCTFDVIPADNEAPEALCQNITVQLSPTGSYTISASDINNGSNDNCAIQSISVSPNTFDCNDIGDNTVTLTVTDTSGNTSNCTATVTVEDNTAPTNDPTECGTIGPLVIDDVTGDVTVTQAMINAAYSGTDACGIDALVLAQTVFGCNDIGTNYNVQLTITDVNGNSSTCSLTVIIEAPVISSGSLEGIVLNTGNIETPSDFIAISSCTDLGTSPVEVADDVELTLTIDPSLIPNIDHWEYSIDDGVTWIPIANTDDTTVYTFNNVTLNTFVRVVILSGNCQQLSPDALIRIVPPDLPPTIVSNTALDVCFPDPVTVNAESSIDEYGALNEGGLFNSANLNNLGWIVDGAAEMSAGGNNTNNTYWKETNGPKKFNGRCYDTTDNTKFAIVSGNSIYDAPDHTIAPLSTLETPIFSTVGLPEAILHFDQAYYLEAGAWNTVELSYDGGATYTETLNPGTATNTVPPNTGPLTFNYTGPSNSGFMDQGFNGQCNNSDGTFVNHATEITLPLGEAGLRIKFTYSGTANSVWALDNIRIPYSPVEEVLEWEDDLGNITYGNTITKTPITPGAQQVGVTALVNDCRADNDDGTTFVTFNASLGYAGQSFTPASGECGQSTIDLKAYDNTKTALENYTYGAYQPGLYTYPGELIDHDNNAGTATIPAPNYPGTGVTGSWSLAIVSQECATFAPTFDSATDPWTKFTAPPGVYDLTWTLGIGCSDVIRVTINSCNNLNFDGTDDFVSFKNNYALNSPFSIETWVKPNSITGNNTILSKRLATSTDAGYDLSLESNGRVRFNWFTSGADGYIESNYSIFTNRWYHIAVTFDGSTYLLYIDGIEVGTVTGTINAPDSTGGNVECLLGALDPSVGTSALATRHFNGWIDELRIWNKAITENQIRYMMNQEIMNNGAVRGEVVPQDIPGLTWATDLDGYYRMDVGCGDLSAHGGKGPNGRLRNIYTNQQETAPLPYTSRVDGQNWATDNSWTNFSVWDAPNSIGIDGITPIDWNIVQLSHNMNSGNKDITVLGLISDVVGKEFTIADPVTAQDETNDGQGLWVTHYLKLDGRLDLVGESQLIQKRYNVNQIGASIFDNASAGYAERDQQGTVNPFNYNYFSSPFAPNNAIVNNENTSNAFSIGGVLRDGTTTVALPINRNIVWTANNTAGGGNPTQVSTRWLYAYNDNTGNTYSEWEYLNTAGTLNIGLGYTMKGSGNSTTEQNYVYVGKPNNGTISNTVSPAIGGLANDILVGNPYPSAIDAIEFIKDNIPLLNPNNTPSQANSDTSESINGTIYFWEHYAANNTHILRDYQGGYATYNLSGGLTATTPPITEDGVIIIGGNGTVIPKQYVPIAQGFFVTGSPTGGLIKFHNDQRVFERENASSSVFFEANDGMEAIGSNNTSRNSTNDNIIQRLRLNFKSPEGADRPLLLAFTPNNEADDGFNYGYDAPNYDTFPSDLSWSIENERYVIQGVGQFDITKKYPFILELGIAGKIEISLEELENFDAAIDVYIYDALLGTYAKFNDSTFEMTLDANDYMDRFYLAFENEESLNVADNTIDSIRLYYLNDTKEIYINWVNSYDIKEVQLINIIGQTIRTWDNINPINSHEIKIPVKHISEGNYIIKVINSHGLTTNKKVIIKQ